jgi:hypothetical protein
MARFLLTFGAYLSLAPTLFLLIGAVRKVYADRQRIARLQMEGALILVLTLLFRLFLFDFVVSLDAIRETSFTYWFDRGEHGFFAVGFILFFLGFFLERRPRPGLNPWPPRITHFAKVWMWVWLWIAVFVAFKGYGWTVSSWSPLRTCIAWSFLFFSGGYCYLAFIRPDETRCAEGDLLGIEE